MATSSDEMLKYGVVKRILKDFGFISADDQSGQEIYFKLSWFRGKSPIKEGDRVSFHLKVFEGKPQAWSVARVEETTTSDAPASSSPQQERRCPRPSSARILEWAYLGYIPETLSQLCSVALKERWEFRNKPHNPDLPYPILHSYLLHTFGRLFHQNKIVVNERAATAAFNTGLVDRRYESIYAIFGQQQDPRCAWRFVAFCIAGEGQQGKNLVRYFNPLPKVAHYFDDPSDLLYDTRAGKPEFDARHIVIDNISRWPHEFIEENCPQGFTLRETSSLPDSEKRDYFLKLGDAIENNDRSYRAYINRFRDALDLTIKRVSWNFKTAIPQYYPRLKALTLLLPISLVSDDRVDIALVVERTASGNYLGHTILPLDWAYKNARLVCRPDSDWLVPNEIIETTTEEGEE